MNNKKVRHIAIIFSILVHLLLLLFIQEADRLELLFSKEPEIIETPFEDRLVFELVETPEDAIIEEPSADTDLVSDKNTKAHDLVEEQFAQSDLPFSEGDFDIKEFQQPEIDPQPEIPASNTNVNEFEEQKEKDPDTNEEETGDQDPYQEQVAEETKPQNEIRDKLLEKMDYKNVISSISEIGGLSFNTYDWDFSSYLLAMKKRIRSNWHPPYAFTHMGAISGSNKFRFRVMPHGKVKNLEMLDSDAHYSLNQSSSGAISSSSPFFPLPTNFPEEYLEVTITFHYIIR